MEKFFCLDCKLTGELDVHGRCGCCGSNAVVFPEHHGQSAIETELSQVIELEKMYGRQ